MCIRDRDRTKKHLNSNLKLLIDWAENNPGLSITPSKAAAIVFAKLNIPISSEKFVFDLRDKYSVLLTAGSWHGLEGFIRIGYGTEASYVQEGLDRITKFMKSF